MKLVIGEQWSRGGEHYHEILTVRGIEEIDEDFENGTVVLPTDGDSKVEVTVENQLTPPYNRSLPLRELVNDFNRGEAVL